ncbi:ribosome biogenesis GTPase YqeH [Erysipelatoclostridium sp. An15]|uniref:ribosome biogenesis GTPase YqeH n=1 Tax=Erysipelatoclostridium sp. An15 TaxID=1965566 RepID=UPI000B3796E3|nr:ribosome biogenesis GTPase YqeH [Erysipelatoclostridium sp. An15]OUQ09370.1 ribosome biogenesis GTPase YqeH [Erysipelatoclostridium sp. An15]
MTEEIRCFGCGAVIQSEDEKKIGFVPKNALNKDVILCKRCFRLKNYHELQKTSLTNDDFLKILQEIGNHNCLVVYIVDLFDYNGSIINGLTRHLNNNDILVVGNKRDVLPKSVKDIKIEHWLRRQLKESGIKPVDVILSSAVKNYNLDLLIDKIEQYRNNRNVYVVGVTNVGKSSLINALLKHYSQSENLITTSEFPGTTLDLIEIPLDDDSYLYDSPGIINEHQIAHLVKDEDLKIIIPKSELRPISYQLNSQQTLYFGGLARLDYIKGEKTSFTCFFPKRLKINRTKLSNGDALYNRHLTLQPEIESIKDINDMAVHVFKLPNYKVDIVISGLGFVSINCPGGNIKIHAPKSVGVFIREALI